MVVSACGFLSQRTAPEPRSNLDIGELPHHVRLHGSRLEIFRLIRLWQTKHRTRRRSFTIQKNRRPFGATRRSSVVHRDVASFITARSSLFAVQFPAWAGAVTSADRETHGCRGPGRSKRRHVEAILQPGSNDASMAAAHATQAHSATAIGTSSRVSHAIAKTRSRSPVRRGFGSPTGMRVLVRSARRMERALLPRLVGTGVDVFVRPVGERMRRRMNLMNDYGSTATGGHYEWGLHRPTSSAANSLLSETTFDLARARRILRGASLLRVGDRRPR